MAIWDMFRKKKNEDLPMTNTSVGFILFNSKRLDWDNFASNLNNDWGMQILEKPNETGQLVFEVEGMMVACGFIEARVPENEAERNARNNFLWKDAVQTTETHEAHAILSVMRGVDSIKQSILFTKIASSLLKLDNAIGIYQNPTVIPSDFYITAAEDLKNGNLPILNWIYIGIYPDEDLFSGYTFGMTQFNKAEVEVIRTTKAPDELYGFLINIASYVIENNVTLNDGETIGFTADEKLKITRSNGVSIESESLKIDF